MIRVLTVDDDPRIRSLLADLLEAASMDTEVGTASSGEEALDALEDGAYDAVLLDVDMPGMDGFQVLRRLRERGQETPVILLTGIKDQESVVRGLEQGADDYVTKPFDARELVARLQAVTRRASMAAGRTLRFLDVEVDVVGRRVQRRGHRLSLTPTEFDLLVALLRAEGRTLSRTELLRTVWEMDFDPGTNLLDVHLSRLRSKLEAAGGDRIVHTVRGEGFRIGAD